jgi:hypothetical protein
MKKTLICVIAILSFCASCKKSSSDPSNTPANTITATVDGVSENFNTSVYAKIGTGIRINSALIISGSNSSASGSDLISLTLNTNNTIDKGDYTNNGSNGVTSIVYSKGVSTLANPNFYATDVNGVYLSTITITSISNTNVQGTFSGKLVFPDGKTTKMVTDGKFNVNVSN